MPSLTDKQISLLSWLAFGLALIALTLVVSNAFLETQTEFVAVQQHLTEPIPRLAAPLAGTATWKTYRSEQMGFEVKYPGDWTSSFLERPDFGEGSRRIDFNSPSPVTADDIFIGVAFIKNSVIYSSDKGRNLTFREEIEDERLAGKNGYKLFSELRKPGVGEFEERQIALGGYSATEISYTSFHARSGLYYRTTVIFEEKHNFRVGFDVSPYSKLKEKDYLSTIDTILSTFKFIEPR